MNYTKPNLAYPLANKSGEHIPHEVALPLGVLSLGFTADQSQPIGSLGSNIAFISAEATEDCFISMNSSLAAGLNANTVFIPKDTAIVFSIGAFTPQPPNWDSLYCIAGSTAGKLIIQTMGAWGILGEDTQRSQL